MGLTLSTITSYGQPVYQGSQVYLSWTSADVPPGSWYQLYIAADGVWSLAWWGQTQSAWVAAPPDVESFIVGTVPAGEEQTPFISSLPVIPLRQVTLSWIGGQFEADDLAGFNVYGELIPGGGIQYGSPLSVITAYPAASTPPASAPADRSTVGRRARCGAGRGSMPSCLLIARGIWGRRRSSVR